jgi:hypothetical protein
VQVWYFCHFSSMSTISPFTNLYFSRLGEPAAGHPYITSILSSAPKPIFFYKSALVPLLMCSCGCVCRVI